VTTFPPQPADLVKITETFSLGTTVEIAQWSVWWRLDTVPVSDTDWDTVLTDLSAAAHGAMESFSPSGFSGALALADTKASRIGTDGKVLAEKVHVAAGGDWDGGSSGSLPWSSACVVSLYTYTPGAFVAHGGRRRGRVYLGPLGPDALASDTSGEISSNFASGLATHFHTYLTTIQSASLGGSFGPARPGVLSRMNGTWSVLTDLVVDEKLDTQRRRSKSQTATRHTVSY
jgi:hypothetical protein